MVLYWLVVILYLLFVHLVLSVVVSNIICLLEKKFSSLIDSDFRTWTAEDDIMHITLNKRDKGQTWASPISGQGQLDAYSTDLEQKRLMLQRFQEEVRFTFNVIFFVWWDSEVGSIFILWCFYYIMLLNILCLKFDSDTLLFNFYPVYFPLYHLEFRLCSFLCDDNNLYTYSLFGSLEGWEI